MLVTRNGVIAAIAASAVSACLTLYIRPDAPPIASAIAERPHVIDAKPLAAAPRLRIAEQAQYASTPHPSRNLFTYDEPVRPPAPVVRVPIAKTAAPQAPAPKVIAAPEQPQAPRPPDVPFRCIGRFGPANAPLVALAHDRDVINVHAGDVVDGKFIVRSIGIESVEVGFVGFPRDADRRIEIGR